MDKTAVKADPSVPSPGGRLASIDALRGFDMLFITGLSGLISRLCVALGYGSDCWLAKQMVHPPWIGLTQHDTIFPLFIFIAGLSFPFSVMKQKANGRSTSAIALRVLKRLILLVLLGMVYERFFSGVEFRFGSVLARIGISWAAAACLFLTVGTKGRMAVAAAALLGYWGLNLFVPAPDNPAAGVFTPQGNIVCWIDRVVTAGFGRIIPGSEAFPFDNQALLANIPATVTAMLGMFTGEFLLRTRDRMSGSGQTVTLFASAAGLVAAGCFIAFGCGDWSFPVSKPLWSPSFTLIVGGYSVAIFALFHWLIDVKRVWKNTTFFRVIGMNAITIYLAQPLLGLGNTNKMLFGRLAGLFPERWDSVILSATHILVCWSLLYLLHRKKIYLKV